jgi:hypothetical protein
MALLEKVLTVRRKTLNKAGLLPMQKVLKKMIKKGVKLENLHALELFGYIGEYSTKYYAPYVSSLDLWEVDPKFENDIKKAVPNANILITDSFEEVKKNNKKYNFIIVDNNNYSFGDHFEHFDLFPVIFKLAMDESILILNVWPDMNKTYLNNFKTDKGLHGKYTEDMEKRAFNSRSAFYKTDKPEHLTHEKMRDVYAEQCKKAGFNLEWSFFQKRTYIGQNYYFVMKIKK